MPFLLPKQQRQSTEEPKLLLHPFNGLFSRTTWVSQYQKGKTSLDLNKAGEQTQNCEEPDETDKS